MQLKCEIMSADKTSSVVQKGEPIPCPIYIMDGMTYREIVEAMARAAWSIQKAYNLANTKREARSVIFSFGFESFTGKPACVKD